MLAAFLNVPFNPAGLLEPPLGGLNRVQDLHGSRSSYIPCFDKILCPQEHSTLSWYEPVLTTLHQHISFVDDSVNIIFPITPKYFKWTFLFWFPCRFFSRISFSPCVLQNTHLVLLIASQNNKGKINYCFSLRVFLECFVRVSVLQPNTCCFHLSEDADVTRPRNVAYIWWDVRFLRRWLWKCFWNVASGSLAEVSEALAVSVKLLKHRSIFTRLRGATSHKKCLFIYRNFEQRRKYLP
jgi:hypothetical protein